VGKKSATFLSRNSFEELEQVKIRAAKFLADPSGEGLRAAEMWFRKLTLLHKIPSTVANHLLEKENLQKLMLLAD